MFEKSGTVPIDQWSFTVQRKAVHHPVAPAARPNGSDLQKWIHDHILVHKVSIVNLDQLIRIQTVNTLSNGLQYATLV